MERDVIDRAREAFAAYRGLGRQIIDDLIAELEHLRAAARAFDDNLSTDCDGPERDNLRRLLPQQERRPDTGAFMTDDEIAASKSKIGRIPPELDS